jgi:nucleoside-diphosphate-sugar epimerase
MSRMLAVGLGYSVTAVAERLAGQGWRIAATSRSEAGLSAIRARDYEAVPFSDDAPSPEFKKALAEATHLLLSAPPSRGDEMPARTAQGDDPVLNVLAGLGAEAMQNLKWIGYLSTIGVYGDHGGAWVDETTEPAPNEARSVKRLVAEREWQKTGATLGKPVAILRLSGIYGPGRNAIARLKAGTERRIYKPGQVFNRIHVEDIAGAVEAAIARNIGGVFSVTDDEPAPPQDIISYSAELLGIEPPPMIDWDKADLSPMARSFYLDNRRVRNARMKQVLGVKLRYPTYREGLRALLASS